MDSNEVTVAEAVVNFLQGSGIEIVFGNNGTHVLPIFDKLKDVVESSKIRYVNVKHEFTGCFIAEAYSKLSNKVSTCIFTAGPGATNSVTGVATAKGENVPLIHITGTVGRRDKPFSLHGVDTLDFLYKVFEPVSKASFMVRIPEELQQTLERAFILATSEPKGPVHIDIPFDMLGEKCSMRKTKLNDNELEPPMLEYARAVVMLLEAKRPVIIAGSRVGRENVSDKVMELAELLGAPMVTLGSGMDAIPCEHPLYAGYILGWLSEPIALEVIGGAELVIVAGERLDSPLLELVEERRGIPIIHIDTFPSSLTTQDGREIIHLIGPLSSILEKIIKELHSVEISRDYDERVRKIMEYRRRYDKAVEDYLNKVKDSKPISPIYVVKILSETLPKDAILTLDAGGSGECVRELYRIISPRKILATGPYGSMGYAIPASIGASLASKDRLVVAITGDGGALMSLGELATVKEVGKKIITLIFNDSMYGILWKIQNSVFGRSFAVNLPRVNFAEIGRGFGIISYRVENPNDLRPVLAEAVNSDESMLIDIVTDYRMPMLLQQLR